MPRSDLLYFCRESSFTETQVANALTKLYGESRVMRDEVERKGRDAQIFWIKAKDTDIELCKENLRQRLKIVDDTNFLETDGQHYCRSLFFNVRQTQQTQGFGGHITAPKKLGKIPLLYSQKGDIELGYTMSCDSFTLLVEVKNQFYSVTKGEVDKLIGQAIENSTPKESLMPVMIANYLDANAKDFLTYCGVPYLELGRQIIRASVKAEMIELYTPEIALHRFQFVAKRAFRNRPGRNKDPRSLKDIALISDPTWIQSQRERWLSVSQKVN